MQHSLDEDDTSVVVPHFCLLAAMQTLCALVSHDDAKQRWLQSTGILGLLQRLTVQDNLGSGAVPLPPHPVIPSLGENTPLRLWRESARIIAMISADAASQTMIRYVPCLIQMQASIAVVLMTLLRHTSVYCQSCCRHQPKATGRMDCCICCSNIVLLHLRQLFSARL